MSEKTKIPTWRTRLPFESNCNEVAAQMLRESILHRQKYIGAVNNCVMAAEPGVIIAARGEATLRGQSAMVTNAIVVKGLPVASPELGKPDLVAYSRADARAPNPPAIPDFLLLLFARSKRDLAAIGDINELYSLERAKFGRARADWRYWAQALKILLPLLGRAISRAMKLAVIIDASKRIFFD